MSASKKSRVFKFAGLNIKGTPAMPGRSVTHDVRKATQHADVLVFQEFRWEWYWVALARVVGLRWQSSPTTSIGKKRPVAGAQAVLWKKKHWKRIETRKVLLHQGYAKVSEARYIRGALLQDKESGLYCWFVTTHFVVKGDEAHDPDLREKIFKGDVMRLDGFLNLLQRTGHPIVLQLDANVKPTSTHYKSFHHMVEKHGGRMHGEKGVEYLIVFPGEKARVQVIRTWTIGVSELRTDHEGRGMTARLVANGTI